MADEFLDPCEEDIVYPICTDCPDDDDIEHGRVRGAAYLHKSALADIQADPSNMEVWDAARAAGKLRIIPKTTGTFDGGSPVEVAGYGDESTRITGRNYITVFKDPNYVQNAPFYESIKGAKNWLLVWRTETQSHMSLKPVSINPKAPVTEDVSAEVVWEVENKWFQGPLVVPFDTPEGLFDCVLPVAPTAPTVGVVDDTANTFNWTNNPAFTAIADMEQTLNGGTTVTALSAKPIAVGNVAKAPGQVGVRIKAKAGNPASAWLFNTTGFNITFDTLLDFPSATTDTAASVTGTVSAADPDQKFEFNAISSPTGASQAMHIKVGGTEEILIDYYLSYDGQPFKYTDKAGTPHTGVFTNGIVTF